MKKPIFTLLRIFVSLFLIVILLYIMRDKYGQILRVLEGTNVLLLSTGFIFYLAAIAVASIRLKLIVAAQKTTITFVESLSLTFIGYFFNNFLPTSIGGDVIKGYYLSKKNNDRMASYTSVFVDRIIGLITMVFMAFFALLLGGRDVVDNSIKNIIYLITLFAILAVIFMTNKKLAKKLKPITFFLKPIEEKLKTAYDTVHHYKNRKALMFKSFVISMVSQLLFFFGLGILAFSIGSRIPILDVLLRVPIISMLSLLPSINGLGLREGSTVLLFSQLIGKENAFAVSILWLFVLLLVSVIGGVIYSVSPQFKVKLKEVAP
ncbi:MAG: lysylphosphatidylglycerol synthase transmembrane domain-containing protein [Candidatus Omnitrophica bacterium]|nr:lysylphosphatidylglycerol synthase transmembrane domain-containing protein [Candidatus Omnitrophota bacterium]